MKLLLLLTILGVATACQDNNSNCPGWKSYCGNNDYVNRNCKKSCGTCPTENCVDKNSNCNGWKRYCDNNNWVKQTCPKTCNTCSGGSGGSGGNGGWNGECGKPKIARGRVINGVDAVPNSWPWQIGMKMNGRFGCGGSLVSPNWIVTAAHCVERVTASQVTIVLGDHNRNYREGHEQEIRVRQIISHPSYGSLNNDIALIQLASPAQLNDRVHPVCLPEKGEAPDVGSQCTITGWGKIRHPGGSHHTLQQVDLNVLSNQECNIKNSRTRSITRQMICGAVQGTRKSGCHGDSGGPFVCKKRGDDKYKLHGAVSWGSPRCDSSESNTVFARVAEFRDWIDQYVKN